MMEEYLVFARTHSSQPTQHQGEVRASDAGSACARALERFGDCWVDMRLIPASKIHWVLRGEPRP
ncbi:MAG: hypothetical protein ACRDZO_22230 [Egibacteraceae bacterium]